VSKARLVITAVVVQGRGVRETARSYKVSPGWVSRLVTRYRSEGEAAFEPLSRRPHRQPTAIPLATAELVIRLRRELTRQGLDAGTLMRTGDAVVLAVQVSVGSGACAGSTMSATVRGGWRTVWPTANGVTACSRTFSALSPFRKRC
jgi:Helix-turn-helix domain